MLHPTQHGGALLSYHTRTSTTPSDSHVVFLDGSSGLESLQAALRRMGRIRTDDRRLRERWMGDNTPGRLMSSADWMAAHTPEGDGKETVEEDEDIPFDVPDTDSDATLMAAESDAEDDAENTLFFHGAEVVSQCLALRASEIAELVPAVPNTQRGGIHQHCVRGYTLPTTGGDDALTTGGGGVAREWWECAGEDAVGWRHDVGVWGREGRYVGAVGAASEDETREGGERDWYTRLRAGHSVPGPSSCAPAEDGHPAVSPYAMAGLIIGSDAGLQALSRFLIPRSDDRTAPRYLFAVVSPHIRSPCFGVSRLVYESHPCVSSFRRYPPSSRRYRISHQARFTFTGEEVSRPSLHRDPTNPRRLTKAHRLAPPPAPPPPGKPPHKAPHPSPPLRSRAPPIKRTPTPTSPPRSTSSPTHPPSAPTPPPPTPPPALLWRPTSRSI
ncbi:uncharacterized protein EV422DRAFT_545769 [Fimicolochytrium jonesii]|uniref:uncharacterized protein n=1 Tax=Fimicolochytrium jonesii TaxID=1396493 RepID=UPI0022FE6EA9|nr:uncharacterized protein EV422DRAFT_545769 [Fimicolochytrium jonesii]KAI8816371.1 hypothetical protein EV422DRAFT_545769 [Fimicolochytrium jonesii]